MWALVENNSITTTYARPTAITIGFVAATYHTENVLYVEGDKPFPEAEISIGDIKIAIGDLKTPRLGTNYPANIMSMWTASELEAIGIYEVVEDNTNLTFSEYYINGEESITFASGVVTKSYGVATAKQLNDTLWTAEEAKPAETSTGDTKAGLKSHKKWDINGEAGQQLLAYDWYTIRAADGGTAVPSAITTYKAAVRTASNSMCTKIDAVANVDALAALYVYNDDDPPVRPLGAWPAIP